MNEEQSTSRDVVKYIPVHGLVILGLTFVIALGFWAIPAARAWFSFIPNNTSWVIFWAVTAILLSSLYYLLIAFMRRVISRVVTVTRVRTLLLIVILYFAGAFLLATIHVAPPVETWMLMKFDVIGFFVDYTAVLIVLIYLCQPSARRWISSVVLAMVDSLRNLLSKINFDIIWRIIRVAILFIVPAIIVAKLQIIPVNDNVTTWFTRDELPNTILFFSIYGFTVLLTYMIVRPIIRLIAYLFRPVAPSEISYQLYGPNIAWWIRLSVMFTIIAQFVCFFTAYFGLKLLLSEEGVSSIPVIDFAIPHRISEILHLGNGNVVWTQLQIISFVVAFILSAGISYFAAMTIENLLEGHPVSLRLPILVVVLGLLSTYCGFTMWNGSAATAEELRQAVQTTKSLVDEFRDVDSKTLGAAADDASAQVSALGRRLEQDERERLAAQFEELNAAIVSQEASYQALAAVAASFDSSASGFHELAEDERLNGGSSLVRGNGAVVRELQRISGAYRAAADSISVIQKAHDKLKGELKDLSSETFSEIVKKASLDDFQKDLRAAQDKANDFFNIDLRPALESLESELSRPLPPAFSSAKEIQSAQAQALRSVGNNIVAEATKINRAVAANPKSDRRASLEDTSSQRNTQIQSGIALTEDLTAFVKEINKMAADRQRDREAIVGDLDAVSAQITLDSNSGVLYYNRSDIVSSINKVRSALSELSLIDSNSLNNTLNKINGEIQGLDTKADTINGYIKVIDANRIMKLIPNSGSYPSVKEFQLTPLAFGVIKFFYISLPLLLVQIFIDFGYTIGLIFGVSSMYRRPLPGGTPRTAEIELR